MCIRDRGMPVGWPPRSTCSRWSPAPEPGHGTPSASDRIKRVREAEFAARPGMSDEVLYARDGHLGRILLNRPRVINVLNDDMVTSIQAQLRDWSQDDAVFAVSIQGAGERGLCAGGDVRAPVSYTHLTLPTILRV